MRKIISIILVLVLLAGLVSIDASAATCIHSWSGTYMQSAHPHAYYKECNKCGTIQYTGSYGSKTHSQCSSCGSHSYSGRTCTHIGTCSCGATIAALGHSYGATVYYESAHPHANYLLCTRCSASLYTGGTTPLSHSSCSSCGSHTYTGATCTAGGRCVCGATSSPLGHAYGATAYYDTAHPHAEYLTCMRCSARYNTGSYVTRSHSACASCGSHSYSGVTCTTGGSCACGATCPSNPSAHNYGATVYYDATHPHAEYLTCMRCSARYNLGTYVTRSHSSCASCGTHSYDAIVYYDSAHPHAEYMTCTGCGARLNVGTYATAPHSSCASCGTHNFVGYSCAGNGFCECGQIKYSFGHNYSITGSNNNHPHERYEKCSVCGDIHELETYASRDHAECASCGTHTFSGATCTTGGSCICGATGEPDTSKHNYGATVIYDTVHPHAEYLSCTSCGARSYTGTYATVPHSSCFSCGTHSYGATVFYDSAHPHAEYVTCTGCSALYYTGTNATLPHGDGTGGTCTECGSSSSNSVGIQYITSPIYSTQNLTARVTINDGLLGTNRSYYVQVLCSWDNQTWYKKAGSNISLPSGESSSSIDLNYCIALNGTLYTKVVVFDSEYGSVMYEYIKPTTDNVSTGTIEYYDWFSFTETDDLGVTYYGYISNVGATSENLADPVYVIATSSSDPIWREYILENGTWSATGITYASDPIQTSNSANLTSANLMSANAMLSSSGSQVQSLGNIIDKKVQEIIDFCFEKLGIDRNELSQSEINMVVAGLAFSVDDNVFFGFFQYLRNLQPHNDNFYFLRAKCFGDGVFICAFLVAAEGTAAAALASLEAAGTTALLALATAPTGVGGAGLGAATVGILAEAGIMAGVSAICAVASTNAGNNLSIDTNNLLQSIGYRIRSVADDILDQMESVGGHTLEKHVSQTNNELINRATTEGVDATSFTNKSTATDCVKQNLRKNADEIETWLNSSTNQPLVIEYNHGHNIGYGAQANTQHITYNLTSSKIYMVKDASVSLGFRIISSYPIF